MFQHYNCLKNEGFIDWWLSPQPNPGDIFYVFSGEYDCVIARTIVTRTQLRKSNTKMDDYYDAEKYEEYEHAKGYNPLKCMRIELLTLTDIDNANSLKWNEIKKFGLEYPTKPNGVREITWNKKLVTYLNANLL